MHQNVQRWVSANLSEQEVRGKSVLEVGARAVGGAGNSVRPFIETLGPGSYIGVDIEAGPGVDEICDAAHLRERFGDASFDVVISTEMLEHVREWRAVISNLKHVVRPAGTLLVTTRSRGFPFHAWPGDYWRYEREDMHHIFADLTIERIDSDLSAPGVFVKASRAEALNEVDLSDYSLFSVIKQRRSQGVSAREERLFLMAYKPIAWVRERIPPAVKKAAKRTALSREHRMLTKARKAQARAGSG
jgi:SAM-dependent methyltransferase